MSNLSGAVYPDTRPPRAGEVDPPEAQVSVAVATMEVSRVGPVDVFAMILPVHWDLAAALVAREAEALRPSFVMMNGVAGPRQALWLELGAANRASTLLDGSNQLRPFAADGEKLVKIVEGAPPSEDEQPNLLSWGSVESAANDAIGRHAGEREGGARFGDILQGVERAGFPRASNTYLCNNITYLTGWLMSHPRSDVSLLEASHPEPGARNALNVRIDADLQAVPRVFVHWPSELADKHLDAAADVMRAIIGAQLKALAAGDTPTFGDNRNASGSLRGGGFF